MAGESGGKPDGHGLHRDLIWQEKEIEGMIGFRCEIWQDLSSWLSVICVSGFLPFEAPILPPPGKALQTTGEALQKDEKAVQFFFLLTNSNFFFHKHGKANIVGFVRCVSIELTSYFV